jgi:dipeptidyl aminopeptidase/acylaminoacyl peptidase
LPEDTLGDFEKPALDVWVWDEPLLKTEQLDQEKEIRKQSYWAMSAITGNNLTLLSDSTLPEWRFAANQVGDFALASNDLPYRQERNYAYPWRRDWYKVNTNSGQRTLLVQGLPGSVRLSPIARWAVWFSGDAWVIHGLATGMEWEVTFPDITDTTHDEPSPQPPFSFGGFTERESFALFHSYSDVYAVALGRRPSSPVCLTCNDNSTIQYRVVDVRPDADTAFASVGTTVYLEGLDLTDKSAGWYQVSLDKPGEVITLHTAEASLSSLQWIRSGNRFLFRQGSFAAYPELRLAYSGQFDSGTTLSHTNPQQKDYLWGDVQLYQWSDDDGKLRDGLLYLPAGWQQDSSYPMIVYFYEKMSDELHRHYIPSPSRSTINPAWYTSNGYVVFMPDIHYTIGYPGPSALNAIVSGTRAVLADGYADPQRVGIQGQSWGGYQTAYVITQTGLYKAAMAGAPVSNMTSAYGGIRWGSGMSRQFQYERTQSRIGATLWENPHQYILNSPLFQADRINTPLLIMHNDEDGAVPWYQGVELFMAMRRLGKPAWLLNYNDEDHNLTRWPNRVDLSIRMSQFFDHYLKGASMPPWMEEGIPVDKKGITDGY